jgi:DNA-binding transcriptional MerR regulator
LRLKIGELAKRTGITVRTLHHYDAIGLLKPSARTDAGHRLYIYQDIARFHAIQALRQVGLSLNEIGELLRGDPEPLPVIIEKQVKALESQIKESTELCARLKLLGSELAGGNEPDMDKWLATLAAVNAYGRHFNAGEIEKLMTRWKPLEAEWLPVIAGVRAAMDAGIPPESLEIQPWIRRWMELMLRWMEHDFDLMDRWQAMYVEETAAQGKNGVDLEMVNYIDIAAEIRVEALMRHFSIEDLKRLKVGFDAEWIELAARIDKLIQVNAPADGKEAQEALATWSGLVDRAVDHDPALRERLIAAFVAEPVLAAGGILNGGQRDFIRAVAQANAK